MDDALQEALRLLDTMDHEPTDFEAQVLDTCLRQHTWASTKQRRILAQMLDTYLHHPTLAAELLGQERLL